MILKLDMSYDPSLGLIGVSKGNETSVSKDSSPTLMAAPITIAKSWEAYQYSPMDERMKTKWYLSTVESDSSIGRMKSCHWDMDGTGAKYRKARPRDVADGVRTVASPEPKRRVVVIRDWGRSGDPGHWVLRKYVLLYFYAADSTELGERLLNVSTTTM